MYRGEIWLVSLDPTVGSEIRKTRPVIIISADGVGRLPLRVVVPLTDWDNRYFEYTWMVFVAPDADNRQTKVAAADCLNIRSVSTERFIKNLDGGSSTAMY